MRSWQPCDITAGGGGIRFAVEILSPPVAKR